MQPTHATRVLQGVPVLRPGPASATFLHRCSLCCALAWTILAAPAWAGEATLRAGAKLDTLPVGAAIYHHVQVRSVNARTVMIVHDGGMSSIKLRDLAPEWRVRFGYDPAAEAAAERREAAAIQAAAQSAAKPKRARIAAAGGTFEKLIRQFGRPADLSTEVDLRPKFIELELGVKNQGRRPSCAIFAVVSAVEFENAELTGQPEKFSEEYLSWATRKTVQRAPAPGSDPDATDAPLQDDADEGFSLGEVVAALRGYGIPPQASMPNTFGRKIAAITEPPEPVIAEARAHDRVSVHALPGRDNATRINNLVQALNAGVPVPVGMEWPNYRSLRGGYLNAQRPLPGAGHAVTIVGYRAPTGRIEDAVFIFKNSWGVDWGQAGYGLVTYSYLEKYLNSAILLEVQRRG